MIMQKELIIDLENLKKSGLGLFSYSFLQMVYEGYNIDENNYIYDDWIEDSTLTWLLSNLQSQLYIKFLDDGSIEPRQKLLDLFEKSCEKVNFDEFWMIFPTQTPSGRSLRSVNKEFGGSLTTNYQTAKKKYLARVKDITIHKQIIDIVKARVDSGDIEYMHNIETYINKKSWEVDVKYLKSNTQKSLNEMI